MIINHLTYTATDLVYPIEWNGSLTKHARCEHVPSAKLFIDALVLMPAAATRSC